MTVVQRAARAAVLVIIAAALVAPTAASAAPSFPSDAQVSRSPETGKVGFVAMKRGRPAQRPAGLTATAKPAAVGKAYLEQHAEAFGLTRASQVRAVGEQPSAAGGVVVRYQQELEGVEVLGGQFVTRLDRAGNVSSVNGEAVPAGDSFDSDPTLTAQQAQDAAIAAISKHEDAPAATLTATAAELKVFDSRVVGGPGQDRPVLVYATTVSSRADHELQRLLLIDADKGFTVATIDQTPDIKDRRICDADNAAAHLPCTAPVLTEGGTYSGPAADVQPAYDYSGATYDFFNTRYGRDSLDGLGLPLVSTVRYCDPGDSCPYGNAFWSGLDKQMVYGDGFATADDVVGHELAHGFTDFSSDLFYYYQSGAINESMSDVFGELIDQVTGSPQDAETDRWKVGESLSIGAIRDMKDPTAAGDPDRMGSPNYHYAASDSGGVHINSGVNNKAAYLLTDGGTFNGQTISALGLEKVARLYYVVNTEYLTSGSSFADLGLSLGYACDALVGTGAFTAADCTEVRDAVAATEMVTGNAAVVDVPACSAGQAPQYVRFNDLESGQGFAHSVISGEPKWSISYGYATSGTRLLYGTAGEAVNDAAAAETTSITVPANGFLRFRHAYGFETDSYSGTPYDGGVIDYSTDGGTTWSRLHAGYTGTIASGYGNPLGGQSAFVGTSGGYRPAQVSLASLAGMSVRFRFRIATDSGGGGFGWGIDDIGVHSCAADSTGPDTAFGDGGPAEGSAVSAAAATFSFTTPEVGGTFRCKVDSGPYAPCRSPRTVEGLAEGTHTFSVAAVDPGGLVDPTPATRSWTVDQTAPTASISTPATDGVTLHDVTPTLTFSANETATFDCYIDDVLTQAGCTSPYTTPALTQGDHAVKVIATDRAGNVGAAVTRVLRVTPKFTLDATSAASEGTAADRIVVRRAGGNGTASVKIVTTLAGTARSGTDFRAISGVTVTFNGTEEVKSVPLSIVNDKAAEGVETIGVAMRSPVNGAVTAPTAKIRIADNDRAVAGTFAIKAPTSRSEAVGKAVVTITRARGNGPASVRFLTANAGTAKAPADFTAVAVRVAFRELETSKTVTIPIRNDRRDEPNETIALKIDRPVKGRLGTATRSQVIADND